MIDRSATRGAPYLHALERALLVVAVILFGLYGALRVSSAMDQAAGTRELEQMRFAISDVRNQSRARRVPPPEGSLIGRVEVPRLGVSAIVREGDDAATLRRAVGHIPETALPGEPGNLALAGHRDTFFRGLRHVRTGDRIAVRTPNAVYEYEVVETRVVEPADVSVLADTPRQTLTLVTCYPFGYVGPAPKRFIVRAELTDRAVD
jgi:sortase A